jgi:hypothetical protein
MRPGRSYQAETLCLDDTRGGLAWGIETRPLYKIVRRKALVLNPSTAPSTPILQAVRRLGDGWGLEGAFSHGSVDEPSLTGSHERS